MWQQQTQAGGKAAAAASPVQQNCSNCHSDSDSDSDSADDDEHEQQQRVLVQRLLSRYAAEAGGERGPQIDIDK